MDNVKISVCFHPGETSSDSPQTLGTCGGEMNGNKNSGRIMTAIVMIKHKNNNNNGK